MQFADATKNRNSIFLFILPQNVKTHLQNYRVSWVFIALGIIASISLSTSLLSREFAIVISMHDDRGTRVDFAFRCYIHFCTHFPNPFVLAAASCWLLLRNYHFHPVGKQTLLGTGSSLVWSLHTFRISTLLGLKASLLIVIVSP